MSKKYQSFPGMDDILPGEVEKWQWLEEKARIFFEAWRFGEIRTPILEPTELFTRSIGETTDIVHKEMYTFEDRGERSMTMRPEMTASVARSVIQNGLIRGNNILNLYYIGAMFRAEKPQAGRKRQFHQLGAEIVNEMQEEADFKIIFFLYQFFVFLKLNNIKLKLNDLSLISGVQGQSIRANLRDYFEGHKNSLDKDSLYRLDKNVLRILDSKDKKTQAVINNIPWNEIMGEDTDNFKQLIKMLDKVCVPYEVDRKLVRGLDYYTGVVFEVTADGLGSQDAVAAGGRYDCLYEELGGNKTPCTGFSIGMERLLMSLSKSHYPLETQMRERVVYVAPLAKKESNAAENIFKEIESMIIELRYRGVRTVPGLITDNYGKHFGKADKLGAGHVVLKEKDSWTVKNMKTGDQKSFRENKELINDIINQVIGS